MKLALLALSVSTSLFCLVSPVWADGFLLPNRPNGPIASLEKIPNFSVKHHKVNVSIKDQVSKTTVDQVFHNATRMDLEGTYIFPVPEGATLSQFAMEVDGKMQTAELLQAGEARRIYEDIVRQRIDPGLLEYAGNNLFKARVYPIPAQGDKAMKLSYDQLLGRQEQLHHYHYGLSTEKFSLQPLNNVSISVDLQTKQALKNIYSPSHEISVQRLSENHATVSWEASQVTPDKDFDLYYSTSEDAIGANLLTYKEPGEDGYFLLLASPKVKWEQEKTLNKGMTFVVDTSGSMSGDKIAQARDALVFNLQQLEPLDKFRLLSFSDAVRPFSGKALPASKTEISKAVTHVKGLKATGGTDINSALLEALRGQNSKDGVPMIVFLTDGDPTVGVTNFKQILNNVAAENKHKARLFVFGVGYDVNIPFLDKLAQNNHGVAEYVRPEENIELKVSRLFSQISNPILSGLKLSYGSTTHDVLPQDLPDFFKGSQLMVVGRYKDPGKHTLTLSGDINQQQRTFSFPNQVYASGKTEHNYLPRLWATRKIGYLLDQIRLQGKNPELVEEVVRLSKQYGIITEYTSFLVREDVDVRRSASSAPMMEEADSNLTDSLEATKGSWAISQSRNASKMQQNSAPAIGGNAYFDAEGKEQTVNQVKYVAQRAFYQKKGIWQDSLPADKLPQIEVQRFSALYFALAQQKDLREILALGTEIEFVFQGNLVKIMEKGETQLSPALKKQLKL